MKKINPYDEHLRSVKIITEFMGGLSIRYSARNMSLLWKALDLMINRYGKVFVADAIQKDKAAAELALFRYGASRNREPIAFIPAKRRSKTC